LKPRVLKTALGLAVLVAAGLFIFSEDKAYTKEAITFANKADRLAGVLTKPKMPGPHPCIVYIHGDGPQTRDINGALDVFFQEFAKAGWCVLSWDKAGIGESTGDWLAQSMSDRADEALAAIDYLRSRNDVINDKIGLFGYSQAGWVLPLAASRSDKVAFIIPVSAAVDVVAQGLYFKRNLWAEQGLPDARIAEYLAFFQRRDAPASYEAYLEWYRKNAPEKYSNPMDQRRWGFEQVLVDANARAALRKTTVPVLAIWGSYDLHVDAQKNRAIYEEELTRAGNSDFTLKVFQGANHSLIAMNEKRLAISGFPRWWNTAKFILLGRDVFAEGYFDLLTSWLEKRT
jgi:uncharacterized protein